MCCATKEHLAYRDMRKIQVPRGTRYPTTLEDQGLQMSGQARTYLRLYAKNKAQCRVAITLRIGHTCGKTLTR
jgi:hypothetical protein